MESAKQTGIFGPDELTVIIDNHFRNLDLVLQRINQGFVMEDIHAFRVEIKKLKALVHLLNSNQDTAFELKISKKIKSIYSALGEIRSLQIQQVKITRETTVPDSPMNLLATGRLVQKVDYCLTKAKLRIRSLESMEKEKAVLLSHIPSGFTQNQALNFLQNIIAAIRELLIPVQPDDKSMHEIRKHLKDIQYNISYLNPDGSTLNNPFIQNFKQIKNLSDILGDYHDQVVALQLLEEELKEKNLSGDEEKYLRKIRKKWLLTKENTRRDAHHASLLYFSNGAVSGG